MCSLRSINESIVDIIRSHGYTIGFVPRWKGAKVDHVKRRIYLGMKVIDINSIILHELGHVIQKTNNLNYESTRIIYRKVLLGKTLTKDEFDIFNNFEKEAWDIGRSIALAMGIEISVQVESDALMEWRQFTSTLVR